MRSPGRGDVTVHTCGIRICADEGKQGDHLSGRGRVKGENPVFGSFKGVGSGQGAKRKREFLPRALREGE